MLLRALRFSSVRNKGFGGNVFVLVFWTALAQAISSAAVFILPRLFQPQHFGAFSIFSAIVVLGAVVASGRYEFAIGLPREERQGTALFVLSMGLCASAAILFLVIVWSLPSNNWMFNWFTEMLPWWPWVPVGVACVGWYNALSYLALRSKKFQTVGKSKVAIAFVTVCGQVLAGFTVSNKDAALIYPFLVGQIMGVLLLAMGAAAKCNLRTDKGEIIAAAKRFAQFPMHVAVGSLLDGFAVMLPTVVVAATFSLKDAGYYALAERIVRMPVTLIGSSVLQVFYRQMADLRDDAPAARQALMKTWQTLAIIAATPCVLVALFGESIFGFAFGYSWRPSGQIAEVLIVWAFAQFVSYPTSNVLIVQERTRSFLFWQLAQSMIVVCMLSVAILIKPGSLKWVVTLLSFGQLFVCGLSMALQWRATSRSPNYSDTMS